MYICIYIYIYIYTHTHCVLYILIICKEKVDAIKPKRPWTRPACGMTLVDCYDYSGAQLIVGAQDRPPMGYKVSRDTVNSAE